MTKNKEYGSDFHYYNGGDTRVLNFFLEKETFQFHFSGRTALYDLLKFGIKYKGWKKVGFPSYYCHDVVEFCESLPIEVCYYKFNPLCETQNIVWADEKGSVFINVNFFGVKEIDIKKMNLEHTVVIHDLTHNLLAFEELENKDYAFASLRKQLPLAVGGVTYTNDVDFLAFSNLKSINKTAENIAEAKLEAMKLKKQYLAGVSVSKDRFRELYITSERQLSDKDTYALLPLEVKKILPNLDVKGLIQQTRENSQAIKSKIKSHNLFNIVSSEDNTDFGLVLLCETEKLREELKQFLIKAKIYPAILWPNQIEKESITTASKMLFIHVDFRYNKDDIHYIANTINIFFKHARV